MKTYINEWTPKGWEVHEADIRTLLSLEEDEAYPGCDPDSEYPKNCRYVRSITYICGSVDCPSGEIIVFDRGIGNPYGALPYILVELWMIDEQISTFVVATKFRNAFMATEFPRLVQQLSFPEVQSSLEGILKTFAAYVRHGQGISTISECGHDNLEEMRERRKRMSEKERNTRAGEKANAKT